mmetsp:Transcript_124216/g.359232  ORF Transcript_124216/g.359232 Transcript_124216/m.359232 type:complete len:331 (+) Transcript_124216:3-995(+)
MVADNECFVLGLGLCLLNCLLSSVGFTLQRKAQLLSEQANLRDTWRSQLLWAAGVVLYISAAAPDVIAYTLVPQVVCTTVACFRLVLVTFLAHTFLQERVQMREAIGMAVCSVGTSMCLIYGPRSLDVSVIAPTADLYHPQVWGYLAICLVLLLALLAVEHSRWFSTKDGAMHYVVLPLATGLAFALEKLFNTELGFVQTPTSLRGLLDAPAWTGMVLVMGALGLTDFYLNIRAAARMPVQVFLPVSFALATTLQFFQSMSIFGEFKAMVPLHAALSICGAIVALSGALLIQPPKFGLLGGPEVAAEDLEGMLVKCDGIAKPGCGKDDDE